MACKVDDDETCNQSNARCTLCKSAKCGCKDIKRKSDKSGETICNLKRFKGEGNRSEHQYAKLQTDILIPYPQAAAYYISDCNDPNNEYVVLYSNGHDRDVRVLNSNTGTIQTFTCGKRINAMSSLSATRHAMVEWTKYDDALEVHLLNENFQVISTLPKYTNGKMYEIFTLCSEFSDTFILLERTLDNDGPRRKRLSRLTVRQDKLLYKRIGEAADLDIPYIGILLSQDKRTIYGASNVRTMIQLDIQTMEHATYDFLKYDAISCFFEPSTQVFLIGSNDGKIYVLDPSGKGKGIINIDKGEIKGVTARGNSLVFSVLRGDEKLIYVYNVVSKLT